jgi:hypothetical protein
MLAEFTKITSGHVQMLQLMVFFDPLNGRIISKSAVMKLFRALGKLKTNISAI